MPSEDVVRPALNGRSSSRRSQHREPISPPPNTPPQHKRLHKHVVGGAHRGGLHSRVPSTQKFKSQIQHGPDGEPIKRTSSEYKLPRNGSTVSLRKNLSQVSLKRNKSAAEVRVKPSGHSRRPQAQGAKAAVHFEVGLDGNDDANEDADGWTEASGSASPVLSRKSSVGGTPSGPHSTKHSANNSPPQSPAARKNIDMDTRDASPPLQNERFQTPNAKQITSKLLRTPSHTAAPKISSISATVTPSGRSPESLSKSQGSTLGSATEKPKISRFLGSNSGTPSDSPFLSNTAKNNIQLSEKANDDLNQSKRAKSMGNLTRQAPPSSDDDDAEERVLASQSRKSSATSFNPGLSRTQQKQWLQRASSAIEPQQMSRDRFSNLPPFGIGVPLLGTSYDGRDPRIRSQLERTGIEYTVVTRYKNPVQTAIKRLDFIPGAQKWVRIPSNRKNKSSTTGRGKRPRPLSENLGLGVSSLGLSQSLKESARHSVIGVSALRNVSQAAGESRSSRSTYEGRTSHGPALGIGGESDLSGSGEGDVNGGAEGDNEVKEILRSIWEKSFEMSASQE